MKKCFILMMLGLVTVSISSHANDTSQLPATLPKVWTAEQAVTFALAENPDSNIARQRIEQAKEAATMAQATDYPLVNISSEYDQTNNPMYSFGNILNQGQFDNSIDFNNPGRTDNLQLKAQLNYRLYNGGKDLADQASAKANINISENDLISVHQQLGFEVVKTYLAIIQAEQMVTVRKEALASITAALEVGRARYDAGSLLKQDLLNLELQQSRASENLIQSEHTLELTKRIFLNLLGLHDGDIAVDPHYVLDQDIPKIFDYRNHPKLKRLEAMEQVALAELEKAQGGNLPTLDAFASYQVDNGSIMNGTGDSWMTGVKLNYLLFDGNRNSSKISIAKLKIQEIKRIFKKTELALNLEVQKAVLNFEQAKKRLNVTQKMVGVATEATHLSRARFTEGVILASDLIDFEMRLSDAQARNFAAKAAYQVAIANMRRAAGLDQFSMN